MSKNISFIAQRDNMDCGPACLAMISLYYKKRYSMEYLRSLSYLTKEGVSFLGLKEASKKIGFHSLSAKLTLEELINKISYFPCILHWNQKHFVVLYNIRINSRTKFYYLADPEFGHIRLTEERFAKSWISDGKEGLVLFLFPTDEFYRQEPPSEQKLTIRYLFDYLSSYKKQMVLMFLLLLCGSGLTLFFPFLAEALIDKGVNSKNLGLITYILLAQLSVVLGVLVVDVIRNWLVLYVGTHLSITIISDFLKKILKLPIRFFDTKLLGDFQQRIQDNDRIEEFLTSQSLTTFFSIITFFVFFGVLWYYDYKILVIYLLLTLISISWSFYWLRRRKILDYLRFQYRSENQDSIYEMLNGVTEMKLNQFEDYKIKEWQIIQQKLFKLNTQLLKIEQIQSSGFEFLNQLKNILVVFLAATYVVKESMTLGMLLSISYIIGQMNSPVNQLINFFRSLQDAKLSLERLNEVQRHVPEEMDVLQKKLLCKKSNDSTLGIEITNLRFQYEGPMSPFVLNNVNLSIPEGKITAIIGASGSGKTTLMKILLRFYDPTNGAITYNGINLLNLSPLSIRENCGVVMQDGYIFSDSIERNIATGEKEINKQKLEKAVNIANIKSFIDGLPLGYKTKIGAAGNGISGGQKQRILIARAVYKNPHYIFFDEATSALDAENEKIIHDNLQSFFKGKTVVIIAHRLSTVKNADQIIVLKRGQIVESGNHQDLVTAKNEYYNLVRNQLELGA
ncbi:peptidase domain-containing ABC transporter [Elizabethkingia meningoseptica]|uniref:peptidase domain-containing ABC transporter n=1 Tax=Elizabethkingia meningoseptica TaxID=238 RepID=UPI000B34CD76|nr:peptidase domain-containing ABC transporter [Elizabethkingia meningoseptica]